MLFNGSCIAGTPGVKTGHEYYDSQSSVMFTNVHYNNNNSFLFFPFFSFGALFMRQ